MSVCYFPFTHLAPWHNRLIYFWYFMTISAFSTTLVSNMFLNGLNNGRLGGEFREVIREIARTIPSVLAVTWLNWIIFRFTILLPVNYLLNLPAFAFSAINFKCCARVVMGGGKIFVYSFQHCHGSILIFPNRSRTTDSISDIR